MTQPVNPKLLHTDAIVVFADLQHGITELPLTVSTDELLKSAYGLARLAEIFDIPTLALTIPKRGGGPSIVVSQVSATRSKLTHIQRTTPDSFENAEIRQALASTGRNTLVVCGVATEIVVQWLVLSGLANGYKVHVVVDACGGLGVRSEEAAFKRFEKAGAIMTSVVSLSGELAGDMSQPIGRDTIEVVYRHIGA
jgi:nicotinamidase-related amidase